eukprot:5899268-Pleurochrysis_carterae.AAC.3
MAACKHTHAHAQTRLHTHSREKPKASAKARTIGTEQEEGGVNGEGKCRGRHGSWIKNGRGRRRETKRRGVDEETRSRV